MNITQDFFTKFLNEMRKSLNGMMESISSLSYNRASLSQKKYLSLLNSDYTSLIELFNDTNDFLKIQNNDMKISKEIFPIKNAMETVKSTLYMRMEKKNQKWLYNLSRNIPDTIITDRKKLIQILVNLISVANKATDAGLISVHISPKTSSMIEFTVKGIRIEIDEKEKDKILSPFYCTNKGVNFGLNLVLCKQLVLLLGGCIDVDYIDTNEIQISFTITIDEK